MRTIKKIDWIALLRGDNVILVLSAWGAASRFLKQQAVKVAQVFAEDLRFFDELGKKSPGLWRRKVAATTGAADFNEMKLAGFLLLIAGWIIVLSAIALFPASGARGVFAGIGIAIEIAGLILAARAHRMPREEAE